ncbi:hypothetical protein F4780DRAFT_676414 [Xylariomycetidae sp. FL0641]|nr:hypothetical protein F4780DRAFT_676414 [Xylariomycetidae sp. FL0641]
MAGRTRLFTPIQSAVGVRVLGVTLSLSSSRASRTVRAAPGGWFVSPVVYGFPCLRWVRMKALGDGCVQRGSGVCRGALLDWPGYLLCAACPWMRVVQGASSQEPASCMPIDQATVNSNPPVAIGNRQ